MYYKLKIFSSFFSDDEGNPGLLCVRFFKHFGLEKEKVHHLIPRDKAG